MIQKPEYLVVMTASIVPAQTTKNFRSDPRVRLDDYKRALRFWLAEPHPSLRRILFLENTGYDLSELEAIAREENPLGKEVEFLSMRGNRIPEGRHYGYGEMQMLDEGLSQSRLWQSTSHMIKATGRLVFPSIGRLMNKLPDQFDVFVECRVPLNSFRRSANWVKVIHDRVGAYVSCQLMIFSHDFYQQQLQKLYFNLAPGYPGSYPHLIENLLYDCIIEFEGEPGIHLRWPLNVEPSGYAGHSQKQYGGAWSVAIRMMRSVTRMIMPSFWL